MFDDDYFPDDYFPEDYFDSQGFVTQQDESTIGVYGEEHYTCDRCGCNYPRQMVIVQNGATVCKGPQTNNCFDEPGFTANFNKRRHRMEESPRPLPKWIGEL